MHMHYDIIEVSLCWCNWCPALACRHHCACQQKMFDLQKVTFFVREIFVYLYMSHAGFYRATAMLSAVYAVVVCVCVCVSVCLSHSGILSKWLNVESRK